jgi:hypothetical protein
MKTRGVKELSACTLEYTRGEHLNAEDGEAHYSSGRGSTWIKSIPAKQIGEEQLPNPIEA